MEAKNKASVKYGKSELMKSKRFLRQGYFKRSVE